MPPQVVLCAPRPIATGMASIDLTAEDGRREALRRMLLIREFEETAGTLNQSGALEFTTVHLCIGQEATAVGALAAMEADDGLTSTHRGHGHSLAKGLDAGRVMAELYGSTEGYCKGKGGSMHLADVEANFLGANGVVGSGVPIAAGAALHYQLRDDDAAALSFLGDGAIVQGQVHEALNLAATWDLPLVVFLENNRMGEFTPAEKQHNIEDLAQTAAAYGIPGDTIDGMDVEAVFEAVSEARERAVAGEGPSLIEAKTYRYRGHFEGDPETYRTEEEVEEWKERDPIPRFGDRLVEAGELTEDEYDDLVEAVEAEVEEAVTFSDDAARPSPEHAYEDMYVDPVPEIERYTGPQEI